MPNEILPPLQDQIKDILKQALESPQPVRWGVDVKAGEFDYNFEVEKLADGRYKFHFTRNNHKTKEACQAHFLENFNPNDKIQAADIQADGTLNDAAKNKITVITGIQQPPQKPLRNPKLNPNSHLQALVDAVNDPAGAEKTIDLGGNNVYKIKYDKNKDEFEILAGPAPNALDAQQGKNNFFAGLKALANEDVFKADAATPTKFRLTQEGYVKVCSLLTNLNNANATRANDILGAPNVERQPKSQPQPVQLTASAKIFEEKSSRDAIQTKICELAGSNKIKKCEVADKGTGSFVDKTTQARQINLTDKTGAIQITTQNNKTIKIDHQGFRLDPDPSCYEMVAEMNDEIFSKRPVGSTEPKGMVISATSLDDAALKQLAKFAETLLSKGIAVKVDGTDVVKQKVRENLSNDTYRAQFDQLYAQEFTTQPAHFTTP